MIAFVLPDAAAAQADFHRGVGFDVVPSQDAEAAWVVHAEPGDYWSPRGAPAPELLAAVPPRFGVVYGVRRGAGGVALRPVVRASGANGHRVALHGWYPFDVLAAPPATAPAPRRSLDEEIALALELDVAGQSERARLEAIEARLARLEAGVAAKLRWKLIDRRRASR